MNEQISNPTENKSERARKAFQISIVPVVGLPIVAIYLVYQAIQTSLWQFWATAITLGILTISDIVGLVLIRRRRHELGIWVIFTGWIPMVIIISALFSGMGFAILFGTVLINSLVATQILPPRQARALTTVGAVGGLIALLEDMFLTTERLGLPTFQQIVTYLIFLLVALYTYTIIRQFRDYSLRTKLVVVSVAAVLVAIAIQGYVGNRTISAHLKEDQEQGLFSAASQTASDLDGHIDNELNNVRVYAQITDFQKYLDTPASQRDERLQRETSNTLQNLIKRDPLYIKSHALLDSKGISVLDTNPAAIGTSYAGKDFFEQPFQTSLPYISSVEFPADGSAVLYFTSPVHGEGGNNVGVLVVTYDAAILQKWLVQDNGFLGAVSFPVLVDENHVRLAHGTAPDLNFKSIVPLDSAKRAELQSAGRLPNLPADQLSTNLPAFDEALSNADVQPNFTIQLVATGEKFNYGTAVRMETRPWLVAYFQPTSVYVEPLQAQTRSSLLVAIGIGLVVALAAFFVAQALSGPIIRLTAVAEKVSAGDINTQAEIESSDEIGTLARAFNSMTARLREFISTLEERVTERTYGLELAAEVGRSVSQVRSLDVMLSDAVEIIRSRFNLYYVQVYLANPSMTTLVLQSGTGKVGAELVDRGHSLPLDTASINGRAATEKKSVVISDTLTSVTFKPNPLLPQTRSELAVPLMVGEKIVGVLDMQSEQPGALSKDSLTTFEALAGQVAIAIQNSLLLAETEQARAEVEAQARRLVRAGWEDYLDAIHTPERAGFVFEQNKVTPLTEDLTPGDGNAITTPIAVIGEPLGNLVVELEGQVENPQAKELVNLIANQVAQRVENLRLLETAERYRIEAEEASRRLTREGWKTYIEKTDETLSYIYDLKEVRPVNGDNPDRDATAIPLKIRDEIIGKLAIQGMDTNDKEMVDLANAVADRLSTHIENLRQFEETMRGQAELDKRAQQLAAVAEISTVSSKELDIEKMLQSVVNLTRRKFSLYHAHVFTFNENSQVLEIQACGWKEGDEHEGTHGTTAIRIGQEQSLVARAARTKQPVIVNDVRNESGWLPNPLLPDTLSELAVPLIIGDQVLGVLDVQSDHINAFTDEDANIQTTLASQVATALQNARSFTRAQQQADRETTLNLISQKIQSATTVDAVLQIAARELGHALGAPMTIAQLSMKDKK